MTKRWPQVTGLASYPSGCLTLQSGDPVFRPPEAGGFVRLCRSDPLPVSASPFRSPSASRSLLVRWSHRGCFNVLVPVATETNRSLDSSLGPKSRTQRDVTRIAVDFCRAVTDAARYPPRFPFAKRTGATPSGETGETCRMPRPKPRPAGPSYQLSLTFMPLPALSRKSSSVV